MIVEFFHQTASNPWQIVHLLLNAYFQCIFTPLVKVHIRAIQHGCQIHQQLLKNLMSCRSQRYVMCSWGSNLFMPTRWHEGAATAGDTVGHHYGSIWSGIYLWMRLFGVFLQACYAQKVPPAFVLEISEFVFECSRECPLAYLCRCCPAAQWKFKYSALGARLCRISEN